MHVLWCCWPPPGGVSINIFGIQLSSEQPLPRELRPRMELLLDAFIELMGEYGQNKGQPKLLPFWLPIRWTEPGMAVEQVSRPQGGMCLHIWSSAIGLFGMCCTVTACVIVCAAWILSYWGPQAAQCVL